MPKKFDFESIILIHPFRGIKSVHGKDGNYRYFHVSN